MRRARLPRSSSRSQRGITIVESLVATTIGALVLGLSTTSVLALAANEQQSAGARALVAGLEFARAAAVARRVPVAVCGLEDHSEGRAMTELRCASNPQKWTRGWAIFEDANHSGSIEPGELVLHAERAQRLGVIASSTVDPQPRGAVSFKPVGSLAHPTAMTLAVGAAAGEATRQVCVTADGSIRILAPESVCR